MLFGGTNYVEKSMKIKVDRVKEMIAAFEKYDVDHPKAEDVSMYEPEYSACKANDPNFCGTPGCHAGLFGVLFAPNGSHYSGAADLMAAFLSGDQDCDQECLEQWASRSGHWPNEYGLFLFQENVAFGRDVEMSTGVDWSSSVSIKEIVETWKKVVESLEKNHD